MGAGVQSVISHMIRDSDPDLASRSFSFVVQFVGIAGSGRLESKHRPSRAPDGGSSNGQGTHRRDRHTQQRGIFNALFSIRYGLALIISIGIAVSLFLSFISARAHVSDIKDGTAQVSAFCSANFKAILLQYARAASLSADVIASRNGQTAEMLSRSHMILDMTPMPARMAIVRRGKFGQIIGTLKSGTGTFAHDSIDEIPILSEDALKASTAHETIVSLAPVMAGEGLSFAVLHPVYGVDGEGEEVQWGHVLIIARPDDVLREISQLITPFGGYQVSYTLRSRFYPGGLRVFGGSPGPFAVTTTFNYLGHEWSVGVSPRASMHAIAAPAWILIFGLMLTALLATLWSYGCFLMQANQSLNDANL